MECLFWPLRSKIKAYICGFQENSFWNINLILDKETWPAIMKLFIFWDLIELVFTHNNVASIFKPVYYWFAKSTHLLCLSGVSIYATNVRHKHITPGPCITNVFATRRKNFSQWHRSFQRKPLSHWLKFLRHVAITLVIQGPGIPMLIYGPVLLFNSLYSIQFS